MAKYKTLNLLPKTGICEMCKKKKNILALYWTPIHKKACRNCAIDIHTRYW